MVFFLAAALFFIAPDTSAAATRSQQAKAEFKRMVPCPMNGNTKGSCPGYEIDHIKPLCAGGSDTADNMQWLTVTSHRRKTKEDMKTCSAMKVINPHN